MSENRGYYRVPTKRPANRIDGPLAEAVHAKFAEGWPKARIAREFRLNRRTVTRICAPHEGFSTSVPTKTQTAPVSSVTSHFSFIPMIRCVGCGIQIRKNILRAHWPNCQGVRRGRFSLEDCPV